MRPEGIGAWVRRRAITSAQHTAIVFRGASTSYAELAARVDGLAAGLQARGVGAGDRVAYLGNNHPSFIESLFASALLGAIFVPLNTRLSVVELGHLLEHSGATFLISTAELESKATASVGELPIRRIVVDDQAGIEGARPSGSRGLAAAGAEDFDDVIASSPGFAAVRADVDPDDRAVSSIPRARLASPRAWCSPTAT